MEAQSYGSPEQLEAQSNWKPRAIGSPEQLEAQSNWKPRAMEAQSHGSPEQLETGAKENVLYCILNLIEYEQR
jgi:hypothetical protein